MNIVELIEKHSPRVALQFSGGRDSLAMLLLLKPLWSKLTVYFCNTGDAYPETLALVEAVRAVVPSFIEVQGCVHDTQAKFGFPTDLSQAGASWAFGPQQIKGHTKLIDRYQCCYLSTMKPLHDRMRADGVTLLLRGQRDTDEPKSHVRNGEVIDGFTIAYPIADWTTNHVNNFILASGTPLPPFYAAGLTSMPDCMGCTAWLEHGSHKYLKAHYPEKAQEVNEKLKQIKVAVEPFIKQLYDAMETLDGTEQSPI